MSINETEPACNGSSDLTEPARELTRVIDKLLAPWAGGLHRLGTAPAAIRSQALDLAVGDLFALTDRDPASCGSWRYVLQAYLCYESVLTYRLAHTVLRLSTADPLESLILARSMSEVARVRTGVEIHPCASIGPRFVIDHGLGTVIGEAVVTGSDCYILQGVVLGALKVADNVPGPRHPRLGDRVEIAGFARVLGPVTIGDDVVIGSHALVRTDVPAGSQVVVLNQYQTVTGPRPMAVYGVEALGRFRFRLHGDNFERAGLTVDLLDPSQLPLPAGDLCVLQRSPRSMTVQVSPRARGIRAFTHIRIRHGGSAVTLSIPTGKSARSERIPLSA
ncbi:serine O-acetyltransferase [Melissospora conviva]|jgi:serine acetyltransferase|uniref:serine O-acetyltransferase n=1 Tax=Melissospora conviva TaxID=3388432 RepID=UPI003B7F1178